MEEELLDLELELPSTLPCSKMELFRKSKIEFFHSFSKLFSKLELSIWNMSSFVDSFTSLMRLFQLMLRFDIDPKTLTSE